VRAAAILVLFVLACGSKDQAIAELVKHDGPVDRRKGEDDWRPAGIGTQYFLGDAARTADGAAELKIASGGAQIAMQPHTILRFGGAGAGKQIAVELGAIALTGTGSYELDIGEVKLSRNGTIRVTAKPDGASTLELTIGEAQVATVGGNTVELEIGKRIDIGKVVVSPVVDAGVRDATAVAAVDAESPDAPEVPDAPPPDLVELASTGRFEVQRAGETGWKPVGDAKQLPAGTRVRTGGGGTAKLVAHGTTLELAGGTRVAIGDDLAFSVETGAIRAAGADGKVALPGGALQLRGTATAPAEARVDIGGRDAKVTVQRGGAKLTGAPGTELAMSRGESAALARAGTIRVIEAIPKTFDFRVAVGETMTIHDPKPPTSVRFDFDAKCAEGGIVELDRDARYRTAKVSGGSDGANLRLEGGTWAYRLRCSAGAGEGSAVATGRITVVRDGGTRALPPPQRPIDIDADGRIWRVSYQSAIPDLRVNPKPGGNVFRLHVAQGGKDDLYDGKPPISIPSAKLKEGQYTYWFDIDGVKQDKVSTLIINFDQTAAQVYIEAPKNGAPWAGDIDVRGAVLPGWTAAIEGLTIPIDKQRRFMAKVSPPQGGALAIKLSHPQRGIHYYLRRAR
jgi:hypothetical protein